MLRCNLEQNASLCSINQGREPGLSRIQFLFFLCDKRTCGWRLVGGRDHPSPRNNTSINRLLEVLLAQPLPTLQAVTRISARKAKAI